MILSRRIQSKLLAVVAVVVTGCDLFTNPDPPLGTAALVARDHVQHDRERLALVDMQGVHPWLQSVGSVPRSGPT